MKCVCGYEYEYKWDDTVSPPRDVAIKGDEKFIEIYGTFLVNIGDYYDNLREVSLYSCPKCGTIKIERW